MTAFQEPTHDAVRALLRSMAGRSVLVVGDGMLDAYVYGTASRLSPEAPVQIVQMEREEFLLGGAANVAKCLVALGAKVSLCCIVGTDAHGAQFIDEARSLNIDTRLVFQDSTRVTPVKTRIVSGRQHLLRVDRESRTAYPAALLKRIADSVRDAARESDAVLLSDYDKGVLSAEVCKAAISSAGERPVIVDPKGTDWKRYAGATLVKPNLREAMTFLATKDSMVMSAGLRVDDSEAEAMARQLRSGLDVKSVLITRSAQGVSLASAVGTTSFPARATKVEDEAGAGDVVAAAASLALAAGADVPTAAWLGNVAASAKVGKFGTHTISDHEILEALGESFPASERKLLSAAQAAQLATSLRSAGKKVVFTNGCFDILHLGHVTYLENARRLGDALIVGINTDASVRRLKGPERPVQTEGDRARIIAAQACVDGVVLFGDDTPYELIKAIKPDVLCKGADYKTKQDVVGWDVVEANGGRVVLIELVEGRSTSRVIERTKDKA
ncbi:MAG TPA: D-glycero-beta-D-manno-heptose 1-phosphate adenylyltransferase [Planctomycetota bacterium]|nr:D-glycero-beta-D-manno-heptose 1-phosphate adenylyltransferase [Planctomycetota bacterium]